MERQRRLTPRSKQFPPLVLAALVMVVLLAALPSALNLPQSNPNQTLEYAPVPPEDDSPPPADGNLASLGLGRTSSVGSRGGVGGGPGEVPPAAGGGAGKNPATKRCVGNPPRQTEDRLSPPCVAHFQGDNGGATYAGVTGDEVRVIFYVDWCSAIGSRGNDTEDNIGEYFDLAVPPPPEGDEDYFVEFARVYQRYFNERYQTYGRFVHFWVYCSEPGATEERRRADAVDNYAEIKPFAVIVSDTYYGGGTVYIEEMARKGVLNFGSYEQRPAALFSKFSGHIWGYEPSVEQQVRQFASYVCRQIVPYPVSFGDPSLNGRPRKLGLIFTSDPRHHYKARFARAARAEIQKCGGQFVADATFPECCGIQTTEAVTGDSIAAMDYFRSRGVTTVVWGQGYSNQFSNSAAQLSYFPEWVLAGDRFTEDIVSAKYQDPRNWNQAIVVSNVPMVGHRRQEQCFMALREAQPGFAFADSSFPCLSYATFRQLFIGIQVAGPKLTPASVDRGFHAIPALPSPDPSVPSCFYELSDFTCVKDSVPLYWDADAQSSYSGAPGCYRAPRGGARTIRDEWAREEASSYRSAEDPCNGYTTGEVIDPSPGPESPPLQ